MSRFIATVELACLCGGHLYVSDPSDPNPITVAHTLPPCPDYERIDSIDDVAALLKRISVKGTNNERPAEQTAVIRDAKH